VKIKYDDEDKYEFRLYIQFKSSGIQKNNQWLMNKNNFKKIKRDGFYLYINIYIINIIEE
jgi:hypothetical protein